MQASGASSASSKPLSRKERFQLFMDQLKQNFRTEQFYEFYQVANRYMRNGKYLTDEQLAEIENAIRNEETDKFFELFINALRSVYKEDKDLFYSVIGYLFQLGNDTYLLEAFLELEVDRPLAKLVQLLQDWPCFNALTDIYAPYFQPELFRQFLAGLRQRGVFAVSDKPSTENFAKCMVVVFYYTNIVFWPDGDELVPLPFDKFLKTIFGGVHNGNEPESSERCAESDPS